jgi:hypothetical protein
MIVIRLFGCTLLTPKIFSKGTYRGRCLLVENLKECCKLEITKRGRSVLIEKPLISMLKFSVNSSAEFLMVLK